jgi:hypothetical protein
MPRKRLLRYCTHIDGVVCAKMRTRMSDARERNDDDQTLGLHQSSEQRIIVHRDVLADPAEFIGVFLHELAHTRTPFPDQTREFENVLTELLGQVGVEALS